MEKIQITKEGGLIKIGSMVLTECAVETLIKFQDDSNKFLDDYIESLAIAVCFFAKTQFDFGRDYQVEAMSLIAKLSFIHSDLRYLRSTPPQAVIEAYMKIE